VSDGPPLEFRETVVAGGRDDFMEVRHLFFRGTNHDIGRKLAEIAKERHNAQPIRYPNTRATYEQIKFFKEYFPMQIDRMSGVASFYDMKLSASGVNFAGLYYGVPLTNCSVVYYPPATTMDSIGVMSRNFDYTTGTVFGGEPGDGELPACARPYIIEMYPDAGYASIVVCCFDLLGGATDGINSEGLTVAMLADDDVDADLGVKPARGPQAGLNEIQVARFLLDTCADVGEAKVALRLAKLYYNITPCHYIIADRHGRSFIWENSPSMNTGYAIEGSDKPLVTTNFLYHRYKDLNNLPAHIAERNYFVRYRSIRDRIDGYEGKFDAAYIRETNRCVSFFRPPPPGSRAFARTLWHAMYYPEERRMEIDFYLGEYEPAQTSGNGVRRSGYIAFELKE
jgi:hypothetical protein